MKKRLFISSILMTLVLLVAITTATFAWYQASAGAGHSYGNAAQTSSIETKATAAAMGEVVFTPYLKAASDGDLSDNAAVTTLSNIELTDDNGKKQVVSPSGNVQLVGNADSACFQIVGIYVVATKKDDGGSADLTELLKDLYDSGTTSIKLTLTPAGNVVIKEAGEYDDDINDVTADTSLFAGSLGASGKIEITLNLDNDGSTKTWTKFVAVGVRTNNASGMEALVNETETAWATSTVYTKGDVILDNGHYYIAKVDHTAGSTFAGDSAKWFDFGTTAPVFHSANQLTAALSD